MPFHFKQIKSYKRGAKWDDGSPRMCTRCGLDSGRRRRKQAQYTALVAHDDSPFVSPVAYCADHVPDDLKDAL